VHYDATAKIYLAEGHVRLTVGDVEVRAQRLRFEQESQRAYAFGGVAIAQGDIVLTATTLTYDRRQQVASALGEPTLVQGATTVRAKWMEFNLATRQTSARGGVTVSHKEVTVNAPEIDYDGAAGKAEAADVVVTQPGRRIRAQRLRYTPQLGRLELDGHVVVEQLKGERLIDEGVVNAPMDDEAKRMLASPTVLNCDRLIVLTEQRLIQAEGAVTAVQEDLSVAAAAAVYSDRERRLTLTGGVTLHRRDGTTLRADRLALSLADETLEASGNVVTEFVLPKK
jgi:lipopolysaccharide assembly outer membrane protein LptD (OstA)